MPNSTWNAWFDTATTSATTDIWSTWNITNTATDCSTNTQTIWVTWTSSSTVTTDCISDTTYQRRPQKSVEQLRVEKHARLQHEADIKQADKDRIAARKRAMKLLLSNLTKKQKKQFTKHQFFIVEGSKSKRKYRIRSNKENTNLPMANIDVLHHDNDNNVDHRICFHLSYGIPLGDHLLAQKLMLENDEDRALEVSNRHAA